MLFRSRPAPAAPTQATGDFAYVPAGSCYLDAACQTLRPQCVIDAETEYYREYNACGGRVKYRWGRLVDDGVREARRALLRFAGKREKDYCVAFTLNTTAGINLVLHQLPERWNRIVTSEIEHNSVLLPSHTWAARRKAERLVLPRNEDGALRYSPDDLRDSVVLVNSVSNIDGRRLVNLGTIAEDAHARKGIVLVDAAQAFAHDPDTLRRADIDVLFGSGHKMYGPSLGFIIIRRTLLETLDPFLLGGGTVSDVTQDGYELLRGEEAHAILEPGLQNWGGILGLRAAVDWLESRRNDPLEERLSRQLFEGLQSEPRVRLLNRAPSPIVSFHVDGLDAHQLALYLSERDVMCRSGHFCCHSYLTHTLGLPPLLRVSLGLYNTERDVAFFLETLRAVLSAL